jgi:hypothetical protein
MKEIHVMSKKLPTIEKTSKAATSLEEALIIRDKAFVVQAKAVIARAQISEINDEARKVIAEITCGDSTDWEAFLLCQNADSVLEGARDVVRAIKVVQALVVGAQNGVVIEEVQATLEEAQAALDKAGVDLDYRNACLKNLVEIRIIDDFSRYQEYEQELRLNLGIILGNPSTDAEFAISDGRIREIARLSRISPDTVRNLWQANSR